MVLGIIGGVGSGKSTVTDHLENEAGFTVLHTDDIAKALEEPGALVYDVLVDEFGTGILSDDKERHIDIVKFSSLLYSDRQAMQKANDIIHPAVWSFVEDRIKKEKAEKGNGVNICIETALPNKRFLNMCDQIWLVHADDEVRIERLMKSRSYSRQKCLSMIKSQKSYDEFKAMADHVINNSYSADNTRRRIGELLR